MSSPLVFISYSHNDEKFKNRLAKHLRVLRNEDALDHWDDRQIEFGDDWLPRILEAINSAAAAVLLISADFLTSKFISTEEVPRLLQRRANDGMKIFPVIVGYCPWQRVSWLNSIQCLPKDGKPLADFNVNKRDKILSAIAIEISDLLNASLASLSPPPSGPDPGATMHVHSLPPRKPFVGRRDLLLLIEQRLRSKGVVALVGMAGTGKSSLALEAAYRFDHLFPEGRYWVDLRSRETLNSVRELLRALGHSANELNYGFDESCRIAREALAGRRALLILDDAEGIDNRALSQLSAICATTIITSRAVIAPMYDQRVDELSGNDAMELFKLCEIDVDAQLSDAMKLAERLGRLALALVSTAGRMGLTSPTQTCAQALAELSGGANLMEALRLPRRNNIDDSVAESFALSYTQLDAELQEAFHTLGLCAPSGAPAQAVAAMLETGEAEARELLLVLAERSLIEFDGERAEMHPLMHEYARLRAERQTDQAQALIIRHVRYFGIEIGGSYQRAHNEERDTLPALQQIDRELDNVWLAQERSLKPVFSELELSVNVTNGLLIYWQNKLITDGQTVYWQHKRITEEILIEWLRSAQSLARVTKQYQQESQLLRAIGDVQIFLDERGKALDSYADALTLFKQVGDKLGQAGALKAIGDLQSFRDDKDAALKSYDEALKLFTQVGAKLGQANVRLSKGEMTNDPEEFEEAIRLYELIGDRYSISLGKAYYGSMLMESGDSERGVKLLEEAREGWAAIKYESGVQLIDELLAEDEEDEDAE